MKRTLWTAAVGMASMAFLSASVNTQSREQVDRINDSIQVLNDLTEQPDVRIPQYLLERAEAIVVIPDMIRGGFIVGAKHGKGILSVRDRRNDRWSSPAFVKMTGGSVGWQIGAQQVDLVLLVMNQSGVRKLIDNKFTLGGDVSATAGPVGRSASASTDISLESEILTYSRAKGLFAGATFEGVSLRADDDANHDFYDSEVGLRDITMDTPKDLRAPIIATTWTDAVRNATRKMAPMDSRDARVDDRRDDRDRNRDMNKDTRFTTPPPGFTGQLVAIREVSEHPKSYLNHDVMINATVESLYSRSIFSLDDDRLVSTGRNVLVAAPTLVRPVGDNMELSVTGELVKFRKSDIEKRFRGYKLDVRDNVENQLKDQPVILATSIRTRDGEELLGNLVIK